MIMLQCKLDIKFNLESIMVAHDFLKGNLKVRNNKKVEKL